MGLLLVLLFFAIAQNVANIWQW